MKLKLLLLLCFSSFIFAQVKTIPQELSGALVQLDGKILKKFDDTTLAKTKYFLLYFSAHWCPPCRAFTPLLVDFYNSNKPSHPEFEIIFISRDRSQEDMKKYMIEAKMPWTAVHFAKIETLTKINAYAGDGIPCSVLIDAQGKVLSDSFMGGQFLGPQKPVDDLKKLLISKTP